MSKKQFVRRDGKKKKLIVKTCGLNYIICLIPLSYCHRKLIIGWIWRYKKYLARDEWKIFSNFQLLNDNNIPPPLMLIISVFQFIMLILFVLYCRLCCASSLFVHKQNMLSSVLQKKKKRSTYDAVTRYTPVSCSATISSVTLHSTRNIVSETMSNHPVDG